MILSTKNRIGPNITQGVSVYNREEPGKVAISSTVRVAALGAILGLAAAAAGGDREAARAYREGLRLERAGKLREALEAYTRASEREPRDARIILRRETVRQRAAFLHVRAGVSLAARKKYVEAVRELELAHQIDPSNEFTRQELDRAREAAGAAEARPGAEGGLLAPGIGEPKLEPPLALRPRPVRRSWNLRGEPRALYLAAGAAYGIQFEFDDSLPSTPNRLRIEDADFSTAVRVLAVLTKTFVAPLSETSAIVTADTTQERQEYERLVLKTLPVGELGTPEEMNEIANLLRTLLDMPQVQPNLSRKVLTIRGPGAKVLAAEHLVATLAAGRPEVLLELETLEVHTRRAIELGLVAPFQVSLSKLSPLDGSVQSGQPVPLSELFGRPIVPGSPRPGPLPESERGSHDFFFGFLRHLRGRGTGGAGAVERELRGDARAVFGGGHTFFGLTIPSAEFRARLSESLTRGLSIATMRAAANQAATFLVGERFPIVNATFSPIFSGAAGQQGLINPFPSFTFEDLGIRLRVTPQIHNDDEVSLKIEVQTRSLSGQAFNGVPVISNRQVEQTVRVRNGQPSLISGVLSREERSSLSGTPLLAQTPVLGLLFGQRSTEVAGTEVILVLTAHILRQPPGALASPGIIALPSVYLPVSRLK